ncbi:MAG: MBL fold metallo-hydrolase [Eubacteriales bacterium]|nr:MBL fold metallo-hydrolase [Eubacteriales bacterium]
MKIQSLTSGSSGNCTLVGTDTGNLFVDCGASGKYLENQLAEAGETLPTAILVTHEHTDHVKGLGVLLRRYRLPVYMTEGTLRALLADGRLGKVDTNLLQVIRPDVPFHLSGLEILPFRINHDAADPVAFRFHEGGVHMAVATDMGCFDDYTVDALRNLDALLLEANHDLRLLECSSYPYRLIERIRSHTGHLSNEDSARLLTAVAGTRLKHVLLGHLSTENNYSALAKMTVEQVLQTQVEMDVQVDVALKGKRSRIIEVKNG